jgi:hypothetical protein
MSQVPAHAPQDDVTVIVVPAEADGGDGCRTRDWPRRPAASGGGFRFMVPKWISAADRIGSVPAEIAAWMRPNIGSIAKIRRTTKWLDEGD